MEKENALEVMRKYLPLLDTFKDLKLATKVANIWYDLWKTSRWKKLEDASWSPLCPGISLIDHTLSVTRCALEFAEVRNEVYGEKIDFDILLAGALLHDASLLVELEPGKDNAKKNKKGNLLQHSFLGAHRALLEDLPDEVVHIIVSHTWQSRLLPQTPEAVIVCCVDFADADLNRLKIGEARLMDRYKYGFTEVKKLH
jgi:putative nucleotidyltransferase with HDIG domain